ncbi:hypothetical protein EVAR_86755_1 [Eumeta japonica]|uniref:Uncharacterized protein n=1 Tax=Eumeta variegata TaxID=151549 RepID=A0A4C1W1V1_EUMVA|nr:hypothetical protein EVAR_86755_1 [Eumeta japonica]
MGFQVNDRRGVNNRPARVRGRAEYGGARAPPIIRAPRQRRRDHARPVTLPITHTRPRDRARGVRGPTARQAERQRRGGGEGEAAAGAPGRRTLRPCFGHCKKAKAVLSAVISNERRVPSAVKVLRFRVSIWPYSAGSPPAPVAVIV